MLVCFAAEAFEQIQFPDTACGKQWVGTLYFSIRKNCNEVEIEIHKMETPLYVCFTWQHTVYSSGRRPQYTALMTCLRFMLNADLHHCKTFNQTVLNSPRHLHLRMCTLDTWNSACEAAHSGKNKSFMWNNNTSPINHSYHFLSVSDLLWGWQIHFNFIRCKKWKYEFSLYLPALW